MSVGKVKGVERRPDAVNLGLLDHNAIIVVDQPEIFMRRLLLVAGGELQGRRQHVAAETDINEVIIALGLDEQQAVHTRRLDALRHRPAHARCRLLHREAELAQHIGEQRVVLEAIAAAAAINELRLQRGRVELDRTLEQRIEVFERNRLRMQGVQLAQRVVDASRWPE